MTVYVPPPERPLPWWRDALKLGAAAGFGLIVLFAFWIATP